MRCDLAITVRPDIHNIVVERRQGAHGTAHHCHRVCVMVETIEEMSKRFVDHRVPSNIIHKSLFLLLIRKVSVPKKKTGLQVVGILSEVLYRITPMEKDTLVAVDERDF